MRLRAGRCLAMTCIFAWVAFVCGYLVLVGSTAIASAESASTPARIVFQSDRDGPYDLYTMNTDGTDVRRLTNSGPRSAVGTKRERGAVRPRWSPDRTRIVYTQIDYGAQVDRLVIATFAGRTVARLGAHTANGAWSPDGKTLALTCVPKASASDPDAYEQLCLAAGGGSGVRRFVDLGQTTEPPTWSPDGTVIVASGYRSSEPSLLDDHPVLGRVPRKQPASLDTYDGCRRWRDAGLVARWQIGRLRLRVGFEVRLPRGKPRDLRHPRRPHGCADRESDPTHAPSWPRHPSGVVAARGRDRVRTQDRAGEHRHFRHGCQREERDPTHPRPEGRPQRCA
jgi:hypothetical protein